jgi:small subunit ribosomal protein S19e
MANIFQVDTAELIKQAAEKLKAAGVKRPDYVVLVKSGAGRERPPADENFYYIRCASIMRQVYINGPVGISRLRTKYGSKKGHVVHLHHHMRAGGSVIKDSFTALEKLGYVKNTKQGRIITSTGKSFLDKIANEISKKGA